MRNSMVWPPLLLALALAIVVALAVVMAALLVARVAKADGRRAGAEPARPRLACIYAYYEKNAQYKKNLEYFLAHGLGVPNMDYYLVVNGACSVPIPSHHAGGGGKVTVLRRENAGHDFGAWSHALARMPDVGAYDYVFFVNTSVRGPYGGTRGRDWAAPFLRLFDDGGGDTRLVGTSINVAHPEIVGGSRWEGTAPVFPHVQSMFFCLDREALAFLNGERFFDEAALAGKRVRDVILEKEIGMSTKVLRRGWNIGSILGRYRGIDYRTVRADINPTSLHGDPYFAGAYFGETIEPREAVFFKISRFPPPPAPPETIFL